MVSEMKCRLGKRWYKQCPRQTPRQICEWSAVLRNLQDNNGTFCMAECRHHHCRFQATKTEWQYRLTDIMRGTRRQLHEKVSLPLHGEPGTTRRAALPFPRQRPASALIKSKVSTYDFSLRAVLCCAWPDYSLHNRCMSLICKSCQDSANLQTLSILCVIL